jgi:PTH1 family peptidyl-tRNA hydrolase
MGGDTFPRIKIGVGAPPHPEYDWADWVLGTFSAQEQKEVEHAVSLAADAVEVILQKGVEEGMNRFNGAGQA